MKNININRTKTMLLINNKMDEQGIEINEICSKLGFKSDRKVKKWISGKSIPSLKELIELSDLLNCSMNELICYQIINK